MVFSSRGGSNPGRVGGAKLNNVLYREALPRGPTPPSLIYTIFDRNYTPLIEKLYPLAYKIQLNLH